MVSTTIKYDVKEEVLVKYLKILFGENQPGATIWSYDVGAASGAHKHCVEAPVGLQLTHGVSRRRSTARIAGGWSQLPLRLPRYVQEHPRPDRDLDPAVN